MPRTSKKKPATKPLRERYINPDNGLSEKQNKFLDALRKSKGVVLTACRNTKVHRNTYYSWMADENLPQFKEEVDIIKEEGLDFTESMMMKGIAKMNTTLIIFHLKTQGKKRGYIEKSEVEHTGDLPLLMDWDEGPDEWNEHKEEDIKQENAS